MRFQYLCTALGLFILPAVGAYDHIRPCTIHSPISDKFFDLNRITVQPLRDGKKAHENDRSESWHANGYDYPANFTLNICEPVIEDIREVVGVEELLWKNVSAFYELHGKIYSIGQQNNEPVFRGRKLLLNYTDGSPCNSNLGSSDSVPYSENDLVTREVAVEDGLTTTTPKADPQRKTTIISMLCEREHLAKTTVSFVAASLDECTYIFEVRSPAVCGGVETESQQIGPAGVFGLIMLIAILVYVAGGYFYQRTVMHQRGWRQLPNYSMWAGIAKFVKDLFVSLMSLCTRFFRSRQGYSRVSDYRNTRRGSDYENRLIDQLDEEWAD